ncbi:amidohydrolase family protein [Candidatus Latescibacterota bacterium]
MYKILLIAMVLVVCSCSNSPNYDLVIKNGRIIDGTGKPSYSADIAVKNGVIVEIGKLSSKRAVRTIDAEGFVITPGFIDMMGCDSRPLIRDRISAESKLRQGITTMMVGEGGSLAPRIPDTSQSDNELETWSTYNEYFSLLEEKGIALNVIHNVGAAQVRQVVIGDKDQDANPEQLAQMKSLVEEAMKDGAVGISSALIYPPGSYATTEELIELSKISAQYNGVYFTHVRNESNQLIEAIKEAIHIGKEAAIPVHIFHLKAAGQENWPLFCEALDLIAMARSKGLKITSDIYPYTRNGLGLGAFIHPRHFSDGILEFFKSLSDENVRQQLRYEIENTSDWENWYQHVGGNWDNVLVSMVYSDSTRDLVGLSVQEAADKRGEDVWDTFFDLLQNGASVSPKSMNETQKHQALRAPFVCFDSDAAPVNPSIIPSAHPRAFGSFPRVLVKYVREEHIISLEEAIRKMTSLPASILSLSSRGIINKGMEADILIFDPEKIQDKATFIEPLLYSEGIDYVIINGQMVIDNGKVTEALPGKVIRH